MRIKILAFGIIFTMLNFLIAIPEETQIVLFGITIILTGIPHGSLDFYLAKENQTLHNRIFSQKKFYINYLLNMLTFAIFWYWFPYFSVLIFLLISAFHFGEIDFVHKGKAQAKWYFSTGYGLFIILFIIGSHLENSLQILSYLLPDFKISAHYILLIKSGIKWILILGLLSVIVVHITVIIKKYDAKLFLIFINQTICILLTIKFLPFYLAFAFYFGLWHSLLSFEAILQSLSLKNDKNGWKNLIIKALPFSAISLIGLTLLIFLGYNGQNIPQIVSLLFIGISILTLPHFQVFSKALNKNRKKIVSLFILN